MRQYRINNKAIVIIFIVILIFSIQNAYAYIDPGTGSYILQVVIAGLLGALLSLKIFWKKIGSFFSHIFTRDNGSDEEGE